MDRLLVLLTSVGGAMELMFLLVLIYIRMKNINFTGLISIPACVNGDKKISAVLEPESEFGVACILMENFAISKAEAMEIATWLVRNSGRRDLSLSADAKFNFSHRDSAFREAVVGAWQSLCSIELTSAY